MANPPFRSWIKKTQPKPENFRRTLGLQLRKIQEHFDIGEEESHDILYKMYLLVSKHLTRNIVNVWKSNLSGYLLSRIQEHRNFRFTRIKDVSAEDEVIYSAQWKQHVGTCRIVCRTLRYADLSLSCMIFP